MSETTSTPIVAVYGGGFINKGAEAMVRVVQAELSRRLDGCAFRFGIEGIPDEAGLIEADGSKRLHRDPRSYDERWDLPWKRAAIKRSEKLEQRYAGVAALVNVSGYAFGGKGCAKRVLRFAAAAEAVKATGGLIVAMPQAWGPFPGIRERWSMGRLMRLMDAAYTRDETSHKELAAIPPRGCRIGACRDIAVYLTPAPADRVASLRHATGLGEGDAAIAVCPNMRVYDRSPGEGKNNEYLRTLADIGEKIAVETGAPLLLLPHEIRFDGDPVHDDRYLCRLLGEELASRGVRASAPQDRFSAPELKGLLGSCEAVVGSRYHSLVASLAQGVPAVAIGWSHKYHGLFKDFGLDRFVVDYRAVGAEAVVGGVRELLADRESHRARLLATTAEQKREVDRLFDDLAARLRERLGASPSAKGAAA